MDVPDPSSSGIAQTAKKDTRNMLNANNLNVPGMNRDTSNTSMLKRDGSENRLVEDK